MDEIEDQTRSGFGPDLLITDSETALDLYKRNLVDPLELSPEDRADTPDYLFDLVTADDGQLVSRPVNQFVQLACFNKESLSSPPQTLEEMQQESEDNNGSGIPFPQRQVYPMEWPPSKEQTHRLSSPTDQLQAEADSDSTNDSTGESP